MIAAVVIVLALILGGLGFFRNQQAHQEALDRRSIILRGAGGEHPATSP
jgi:hypothetical protein